MRRPDRGAGRPLGGDRGTAEQPRDDIASIAEHDTEGKYGRCVCGASIGGRVVTFGCRTCGAWARWRSAVRIAVHALRGPQ